MRAGPYKGRRVEYLTRCGDRPDKSNIRKARKKLKSARSSEKYRSSAKYGDISKERKKEADVRQVL